MTSYNLADGRTEGWDTYWNSLKEQIPEEESSHTEKYMMVRN